MGHDTDNKINVRACTIADLPFADYVMKHEAVYNQATYDGRPDASQYSIADRLRQGPPVYVLMDDSNSFVAVLVPETNVTWVAHSNTLPNIRGKQAKAICNAMCEWMFKNTACCNIIGYTPSRNRAALAFNRFCGFKKIGVIKNGVLKDGELDDLHIVSREMQNVR